MMTTIYLLRHGESMAAVGRVFSGHRDYPLSERGHLQAERAAGWLADRGIQRIYSSDLTRSVQTAMHSAQRIGLVVEKDANLREIFGGEWEGVPYERLEKEYREEYAGWCAGTFCNPAGGETAVQAGTRFYGAVERICRENPGGTLLIASHGMVIRCFDALVRYGTLNTLPWTSFPDSAAVCVYVFDGEKFSPLAWNVREYL